MNYANAAAVYFRDLTGASRASARTLTRDGLYLLFCDQGSRGAGFLTADGDELTARREDAGALRAAEIGVLIPALVPFDSVRAFPLTEDDDAPFVRRVLADAGAGKSAAEKWISAFREGCGAEAFGGPDATGADVIDGFEAFVFAGD